MEIQKMVMEKSWKNILSSLWEPWTHFRWGAVIPGSQGSGNFSILNIVDSYINILKHFNLIELRQWPQRTPP